MKSMGERRWQRMRSHREQRRSEHLDALLSSTPPLEDTLDDGPFLKERTVAKALASAVARGRGGESCTEPLLAIRAALAARQATREEALHRRARTSLRVGSAAALVALVLVAVGSLSPPRDGTGAVDAAEEEATEVLQILNQTIDEVRDSVNDGDRELAREHSLAARDALDDAAAVAKRLPQGNVVRDRLLDEAYQQVRALESLVKQVQLDVPPLAAPTAATLAPPIGPTTTGPSSPPSTNERSTGLLQATTTTTAVIPTTTTTAEPTSSTTAPSPTTTLPKSTTTTTQPRPSTTLPPVVTTTTVPPTTTTTAAPPTTTTTTVPPPTTTTQPALPPTTTTTRLGG